MLKNNKGITIMMLVITMIMIIILVSLAVYYSQDTSVEAKMAAEFTSLEAVRNACDNALMEIELNPAEYDEYDFFGENINNEFRGDEAKLQDLVERIGLTSGYTFNDRTYLIENTKDETDIRRLNKLELKNVSSRYIVDLQNRKYYLIDGVKRRESLPVYEYKEIKLAYDNLFGNRTETN